MAAGTSTKKIRQLAIVISRRLSPLFAAAAARGSRSTGSVAFASRTAFHLRQMPKKKIAARPRPAKQPVHLLATARPMHAPDKTKGIMVYASFFPKKSV